VRLRYEVHPVDGVAGTVARHVPRAVTIAVTASPRRGLDATLDLTEQLRAEGFRVVPHLAARQVASDAHLKDLLGRMAAVDVRETFVIAGDIPEPAGEFSDAASLLARMHELGHELDQIGIAGYPEGHPFINDRALLAALHGKRPFATLLVSQVCFDPATITRWIGWLRQHGVTLPAHVGIPGPIAHARLLRIARKIGVGESARFLRLHAGWLRLLLPRGYRPDRLVEAVLARSAEPAAAIAGLHFYTFNAVEEMERWRQRTLLEVDDGIPQH